MPHCSVGEEFFTGLPKVFLRCVPADSRWITRPSLGCGHDFHTTFGIYASQGHSGFRAASINQQHPPRSCALRLDRHLPQAVILRVNTNQNEAKNRLICPVPGAMGRVNVGRFAYSPQSFLAGPS